MTPRKKKVDDDALAEAKALAAEDAERHAYENGADDDDARVAGEFASLAVEGDDLEEPETPVVPDVVDDGPATPPALEPHALDDAPVNSKLVGTEDGVILATPSGTTKLERPDPAGFLPNGARIQKRGPALYVASVISSPSREFEFPTAAEAIAAFATHDFALPAPPRRAVTVDG